MAKPQISLDHIDDDTVDTVQGSNTDPLEPTTPATPSQTSTPVNAPTKPSKFEAELWQRIRTSTQPFAADVKAGFEKLAATQKRVHELGFDSYSPQQRLEALEKQMGGVTDLDELNRLAVEHIRLTYIPDSAVRAATRAIHLEFHTLMNRLSPAVDAAIAEAGKALSDASELETKIFAQYGLAPAPTQFTLTCQRVQQQLEGMKQMLEMKAERVSSSVDHPANVEYYQFKRIFE